MDEFNEFFLCEDDKVKKIFFVDEYKIFIDLFSKIDDNME